MTFFLYVNTEKVSFEVPLIQFICEFPRVRTKKTTTITTYNLLFHLLQEIDTCHLTLDDRKSSRYRFSFYAVVDIG